MHKHTRHPVDTHTHRHTRTHAELTACLIDEQKQLTFSFELSSQHGNDPFPFIELPTALEYSNKGQQAGMGCRRGCQYCLKLRRGEGPGRDTH